MIYRGCAENHDTSRKRVIPRVKASRKHQFSTICQALVHLRGNEQVRQVSSLLRTLSSGTDRKGLLFPLQIKLKRRMIIFDARLSFRENQLQSSVHLTLVTFQVHAYLHYGTSQSIAWETKPDKILQIWVHV